ncbi:hypothetical protein KR009_008988 [Drosophila setifemur]|nr:hypothetical protein KR009_008988 [Drosophila setifemur]
MSYLLTEIALEMLGYKFYDTNGMFHLTNFQNNTAQAESHSYEPTLTEFIEQPTSPTRKPQVLNGSIIHREQDRELELCILASGCPKPRRTPAKALAKIMDYESDKITSQITNRLNRAIGRQVTAVSAKIRTEWITEEKRLIINDATEMRRFRGFLQERLKKLDKQPYEKYVRTFGGE